MKADAGRIWTMGTVAAERQEKYKTMEYERYGLVGEAWVEWGWEVEIKC